MRMETFCGIISGTSQVFVWTEKNHEKPQSEEPVSGPRSETGSPEYEAGVLPSGWRRSEF